MAFGEDRGSDTARLLASDADSSSREASPTRGKNEAAAELSDEPTLFSVLKSLLLPLYVPMFCVFFAWGLVSPILPAFAQTFGADPAAVGRVVSARAVGSLAATLPAGYLIQRGGARKATVIGVTLYVSACLWGAASQGVWALSLSRATAGAGYSLFFLAAQTFVRLHVPPHFRGRVLSSVGGTYRLGGLVAPVFAGLITQGSGFRAVFVLQACVSAAALPFLLMRLRGEEASKAAKAAAAEDARQRSVEAAAAAGAAAAAAEAGEAGAGGAGGASGAAVVIAEAEEKRQQQAEHSYAAAPSEAPPPPPLPPKPPSHLPPHPAPREMGAAEAFLRNNKAVVGSALTATFLMAMLRSVRDLLLPIAAGDATLTPAETGYLTAVSYAMDFVFFPLGGYIMDTRGYWLAGALSSAIGGVGLLPITFVSAAGALSLAYGLLTSAALVTGIGNGLSSGIVMAIGASTAPSNAAGPVLSIFNFTASLGGVVGPLVVGALCNTSLAAGVLASVGVAAASCVWWGFLLPRPPRKAPQPPAEALLPLVHGSGNATPAPPAGQASV